MNSNNKVMLTKGEGYWSIEAPQKKEYITWGDQLCGNKNYDTKRKSDRKYGRTEEYMVKGKEN